MPAGTVVVMPRSIASRPACGRDGTLAQAPAVARVRAARPCRRPDHRGRQSFSTATAQGSRARAGDPRAGRIGLTTKAAELVGVRGLRVLDHRAALVSPRNASAQ